MDTPPAHRFLAGREGLCQEGSIDSSQVLQCPYTFDKARLVIKEMADSLALYDRIMDRNLLIRRMYLVANRVVGEADAPKLETVQQLDLFTDYAAEQAKQEAEAAQLAKEKSIQKAMLSIKKKYGKNAILKGINLEDGATARDRNGRIGGRKA